MVLVWSGTTADQNKNKTDCDLDSSIVVRTICVKIYIVYIINQQTEGRLERVLSVVPLRRMLYTDIEFEVHIKNSIL